jgi:hypothetical protein
MQFPADPNDGYLGTSSQHTGNIKAGHTSGLVPDHLEPPGLIIIAAHHLHTGQDKNTDECIIIIICVTDVITDIEELSNAKSARAQAQQGKI